jgi:hypothetical protein
MNNNLSKVKRMSQIAYAITHGTPTDSECVCPYCEQPSLIYSFAVSTPPVFSLYVKCDSCNVIQHFALDQKPPNFKPELVLPEFQEIEDGAVRRAAQHSNDSDQLAVISEQ